MKKSSHTHFDEVLSQCAPTPQTTPSHLSLHLPLIHICGGTHGFVSEHTSVTHCPPGNGFPIKPSRHLQVGPLFVTMHWALDPHIKSSQTKKNGV